MRVNIINVVKVKEHSYEDTMKVLLNVDRGVRIIGPINEKGSRFVDGLRRRGFTNGLVIRTQTYRGILTVWAWDMPPRNRP